LALRKASINVHGKQSLPNDQITHDDITSKLPAHFEIVKEGIMSSARRLSVNYTTHLLEMQRRPI
jgi:hypothetical protein